MKNQIHLTIRLFWLKEIISGRKKFEYRADSLYYHKLFTPLDKNSDVEKPCEMIHFRCKNQIIDFWAVVEVKKISYVQFVNSIPEGFEKGDTCFMIELGKVLDHNM